MRPALLQRLYELVGQGGVLTGPAPERSPSLEDYGRADQQVRRLSKEMWATIDGRAVKAHTFGKGMVIDGSTMEEAFELLKLAPDFGRGEADSLLFIHRAVSDEDIYFISNQAVGKVTAAPVFRVQGKMPFLFDPLMGQVRRLPEYVQEGEMMKVPLE